MRPAAPRPGFGIAVAAVLALAATMLSALWPGTPFAPYMGPVPPLLAMAAAALTCALAVNSLARTGAIASTPPRPVLIIGAGLVFALPTVMVDLIAPWPAQINVSLPQALFFYTAIGFFAESVFHILPLAGLLALIHRLQPRVPRTLAFWIAACPVALIEPVFQIAFDPGAPSLRSAYMAVQLTAFGLVQLALLRRYGIWGAYGARLAYYAFWHLAWGSARLPLLFGTT